MDNFMEYLQCGLFGLSVVILGPFVLVAAIGLAPFWVVGKGIEWLAESWTKRS